MDVYSANSASSDVKKTHSACAFGVSVLNYLADIRLVAVPWNQSCSLKASTLTKLWADAAQGIG